jgi:hypothetical protein
MPRYQFVTNFYQGFGLSFIAVLSQDVPSELTDQERSNIDALNQHFLGQQQQVGNLLLPQYQSILNNPGLSSADRAAVTGQSQGALASAFDSLQQSAQNRLARTRNSAGFGELTDELARLKGIAEAGQAQQNQLAFTNTAFQRQMESPAGGAKPTPAQAIVPAEDLKPLYDFTIDCKACQAKLAVAQDDSLTNAKKPPHSRTNETTPCASPREAAPGAASAAPPNGSSSAPPPALLLQRRLTRLARLRVSHILRV